MIKILTKIYKSKYFPRLFYKSTDGGYDSGVTAYFLIEWKILFSIGILHFKDGSREAFHSHAFSALTWWIKGNVLERKIDGTETNYKASFIPKYTPKTNFHKIISYGNTYALTFRGPWKNTWQEFKNAKFITLTHGRKRIN